MIRLSGPEALACARAVFRPAGGGPLDGAEPAPSGRAIYGAFVVAASQAGGEGAPAEAARDLDTGYLVVHPAGRSYTGEQVVELSCHGSPVLVEEILAALLAAGARAAMPGEFTYRAVLNGRLDLAQAEGVRDLIEASTSAAARVARAQVRGDLSRRVAGIREELIEVISRAEASLEFAEEPEVASGGSMIGRSLEDLVEKVAGFLAGYRRGRLLREGARVVLAGAPNAGKSSLFNMLLRRERAIVSPVPGTTRDFLTERIDLDGIPVTLVDTAGLRPSAVGIEADGVERSLSLIDQADLLLAICPSDEAPDAGTLELSRRQDRPSILVASKCDLAAGSCAGWDPLEAARALRVSAVTGEGLDRLHAAIFRLLARAPSLACEEILVSDARHHEALSRCRDRLRAAAVALRAGGLLFCCSFCRPTRV